MAIKGMRNKAVSIKNKYVICDRCGKRETTPDSSATCIGCRAEEYGIMPQEVMAYEMKKKSRKAVTASPAPMPVVEEPVAPLAVKKVAGKNNLKWVAKLTIFGDED